MTDEDWRWVDAVRQAIKLREAARLQVQHALKIGGDLYAEAPPVVALRAAAADACAVPGIHLALVESPPRTALDEASILRIRRQVRQAAGDIPSKLLSAAALYRPIDQAADGFLPTAGENATVLGP